MTCENCGTLRQANDELARRNGELIIEIAELREKLKTKTEFIAQQTLRIFLYRHDEDEKIKEIAHLQKLLDAAVMKIKDLLERKTIPQPRLGCSFCPANFSCNENEEVTDNFCEKKIRAALEEMVAEREG